MFLLSNDLITVNIRRCVVWCSALGDKWNVKKAKRIILLVVVLSAPQRISAWTFWSLDPFHDRKRWGLLPHSKDNSVPLHYSLYAQLIEGLFSPFFLKGTSWVINSGCKTLSKSAEVVVRDEGARGGWVKLQRTKFGWEMKKAGVGEKWRHQRKED